MHPLGLCTPLLLFLKKKYYSYLLMQKDNFYVHIIPVLVQEVLQEVGHAFQCYMTTDNNVPGTEKSIQLSLLEKQPGSKTSHSDKTTDFYCGKKLKENKRSTNVLMSLQSIPEKEKGKCQHYNIL